MRIQGLRTKIIFSFYCKYDFGFLAERREYHNGGPIEGWRKFNWGSQWGIRRYYYLDLTYQENWGDENACTYNKGYIHQPVYSCITCSEKAGRPVFLHYVIK